MTCYITYLDLCESLFPAALIGLPDTRRPPGARAVDVAKRCQCTVDLVVRFYESLEKLGLVVLIDRSTNEWRPMSSREDAWGQHEDLERFKTAATNAGIDLSARLLDD